MSLFRLPHVRPPAQARSRLDWLYHPGVPPAAAVLLVLLVGSLAFYVETLLSWHEELAQIGRIADPAKDFHEPNAGDIIRLSRFLVVRSSLVDNPVDVDPDSCAAHLAEELGFLLQAPGMSPDIAAIVGVCHRGEPTTHVASGLPRLVVLRPVFDADGRHKLTRITIVETTPEPTVADVVGRPVVLMALLSLAGCAGFGAWFWSRSTHRRLSDLWAAAALDHQTGTLRRETFVAWLSGAIAEARASHSVLSVLCIDIDNLKEINDSLGHAAGDAAIGIVCGAITGRLGADGVVGRLGGDEFCVLLGGAGLGAALASGEAIRIAVEVAHATVGPRTVRTTVSIGAAELAPDDDAAGLLRRADAALYGAKQTSRNTIAAAPAAGGGEAGAPPGAPGTGG